MNLDQSNWKFDKSVATVFDKHVSQSVPSYERFHSYIQRISDWFIEEGSNVYDIGTSTGKVLWGLSYRHKKAKYYGLEISDDMISEVINSMPTGEKLPFNIINQNAVDYKFENASYITSVLTLQFMSYNDRVKTLENVFNGLNKGGCFILVEKLQMDNAITQEIFTDLYHDMKAENNLSKEHIFDKSRSIRGIMKPLNEESNLQLCKNAGFKVVETFFKEGNFLGIICIK